MVDIGDVCVGTCLKSGIGKVVTIIPYSHGIVTEHATGIYPVAAIFALGRETDLDVVLRRYMDLILVDIRTVLHMSTDDAT